MKRIWKYQVGGPPTVARTHQAMPQSARILHVDSQEEEIFIWAEFENPEPTNERCFAIYGTGNPIPKDAQYVGTTQVTPFVWHVYEHPECQRTGLHDKQHVAS